MTDGRTLAVRLAMLRELEQRVKDAQAEIKLLFLDGMEPGDSKAATLDDGTKLGKVSVTFGQHRPTVTDERALLEWVQTNRPDELVSSVRDSFVTALKDSAKRHGAAVIESTDEIVPGIEVREGAPFVSYRSASGAGEVIERRWQELVGDALKALPGGES